MIGGQPGNPLERLLALGGGLVVSRAIWAAARLGVADAIDGSASAAAIAERIGAPPDHLRRLLNVLVSTGVLTVSPDGDYGHSDMSPFLRADHPLSQKRFIEVVFGGVDYRAWEAIDQSVRSGETAFDRVFGRPVFDWYADHPDLAARFGEAMTASTLLFESALLATWTPPPFTVAVDIGGSGGTLLANVLRAQPTARGILFDRPDVVARLDRLDARVEAVGGDFFVEVPAGDLYLLKFILHDWDDDQCRSILANVRRAIATDGRLVVVENVLPEVPRPGEAGYLLDLTMMVMTGGRERTATEFAALLAACGFRMERVVETPVPLSVIEAVAI